MRLKLTLTVDRRLNMLPLNYQYPVSSYIYKTIHASNSDFSHWLHQQRYTLENKRFKLFTFSDIFIKPRWKRFGGEAEILEPAGMREKAIRMMLEGLAGYEPLRSESRS